MKHVKLSTILVANPELLDQPFIKFSVSRPGDSQNFVDHLGITVPAMRPMFILYTLKKGFVSTVDSIDLDIEFYRCEMFKRLTGFGGAQNKIAVSFPQSDQYSEKPFMHRIDGHWRLIPVLPYTDKQVFVELELTNPRPNYGLTMKTFALS